MTAIRNSVIHDSFESDANLLRDVRKRLSTEDSKDLVNALDKLFGNVDRRVITQDDDSRDVDMRMRHLLIRGLRKYGAPASKSHKWYGLTASDSNMDPASLILIGENGAGKSSIFNAMEYMFTKSVSEAGYRGFTNAEDYCRHSDDLLPEALYFSPAGKFDLMTASTALNADLSIFFLSENSIQALSRSIGNAANWFPFFSECLGIGDLYAFSEGDETYSALVGRLRRSVESPDIDSASLYPVLNKDVRRLSKFLSSDSQRLVQGTIDRAREVLSTFDPMTETDLEGVIARINIPHELSPLRTVKAWKSVVQSILADASEESLSEMSLFADVFSPADRLKVAMNNLITGLETYLTWGRDAALRQISEDLAKYNAALASETSVTQEDRDEVTGMIDRLESFKNRLSKRIISEVKKYVDTSFVAVITDVFEKNFLKEGETLSIDIGGIDNGVISMAVVTYDDWKRKLHHPSKYFNTFRFRLFFISLQAALDIRIMSVMRARFPIVIDDIFYANDYRNKTELYRFFAVLGEAAASMFGDRRMLQVIFFTHDEQLMTALARKPQTMNMGSVTFGRLIDSADADELLTCQSQLPDEGEHFVNLISKIYE